MDHNVRCTISCTFSRSSLSLPQLVSLGEDNERVYCKEMAEMMEGEGEKKRAARACRHANMRRPRRTWTLFSRE